MFEIERTELVQGPVMPWTPSEGMIAFTDCLLSSGDDLDKALGEALRERCFVKEFPALPNGKARAVVGERDVLIEAEFRFGIKINPAKLSLSGLKMLLSHTGEGDTSAEAIRNALNKVLESRQKGTENGVLEFHGIRMDPDTGLSIAIYRPSSFRQPRQWTLEFFREGEEESCRTETIPMLYDSLFGIEASDIQNLHSAIDRLISKN